MSDKTVLYVAVGTGACILAGAVAVYKLVKSNLINPSALAGLSKVSKRDSPILAYIYEHSVIPREDVNLTELRSVTLAHPWNRMSTPPEQTQLLGFLASLIGARKAIDIGVYTGLSLLAVSLVLPKDGTIVGCDISEEYVSIGRPFWERAGVLSKIDLRIKPGIETLQDLIAEGGANTFDFIFLDADKENYCQYIDLGYELLRKGGIYVVDNVLWSGKVLNASTTETSTIGIREVNIKLRDDPRFNLVMLPLADGVTLLMKL